MKTAVEVSTDKLRGGFYTPPQLVALCLDQLAARLGDREDIDFFEPSAGDGAFIAGLERHPLAERVGRITSVELMDAEARKCRSRATSFESRVHVGSVLSGGRWTRSQYDAAVGNPPFVRFQFMLDRDQAGADALASELGISFRGVSNLWLPVLLRALSLLKDGGAFSFVVPAEVLTGISAGVARLWLLENFADLGIDLLPVGSFPGVLQEVIVLSGVRSVCPRSRRITFRQHLPGRRPLSWQHTIVDAAATWTRYLLTPVQVEAFHIATSLDCVRSLGSVARFEVATVTGANGFFTVDAATVDSFDLHTWALPLLPRVRHADGLVFDARDYTELLESGAKAFLLSFSEDKPDPTRRKGPRGYLAMGVGDRLPQRYKCGIRTPWYRVPVVAPGELLMSKRSHRYPRVICNAASVWTTDTIYRGRMIDPTIQGSAVVASFHNSLTLLSAEVEGRSFGGGVLELVPSETSRLTIPFLPEMGAELDRLDSVTRASDSEGDALVDETDRLLAKHLKLDDGVLDAIQGARFSLLQRRLDRSVSDLGGN